jgi:hypothetical protein
MISEEQSKVATREIPPMNMTAFVIRQSVALQARGAFLLVLSGEFLNLRFIVAFDALR